MCFRLINSSRDAWLMLIVPVGAACAAGLASSLDGFGGLLAAVRSITAEGVIGNSRADGANGYGSDGTGHGFLVQFHVS
jgi:hypothetical protein